MADYSNPASIPSLLAFSPEEMASHNYLYGDNNPADLEAEIARTQDPARRAILIRERNTVTAGTAPQIPQDPRQEEPAPDFHALGDAWLKGDAAAGAAAPSAKPSSTAPQGSFNAIGDQWLNEGTPQPGGSNFVRGAKVAAGQMIPLAKGTVGLLGATGEKTFGEGGMFTSLKKWGLKGYTEGMQGLVPLAKDTDDLTTALDRAKQGDLGAFVDWAEYGLGYGAAQLAAAAVTSAAGGVAGLVAAGPVGGAAGAVEGAVAGGAVRGLAQRAIGALVAKEAAAISKTAIGANMAREEVLKLATSRAASTVGKATALTGYAGVQEAGSIYPEAEQQAATERRPLDGADLARVWATTAGATVLESLSDMLGLHAVTGKIRLPGAGGRVARGATGALITSGGEAATEGAQTFLERVGAGQSLNDEAAWKDYINSAGLGAIGGAPVGAFAGAVHRPESPQRAPTVQDQAEAVFGAPDVDTAIARANELSTAVGALGAARADYLAPETAPQGIPSAMPQLARAPGAPITEQDRAAIDRQAELTGQATSAGFAAERQSALDQAQVARGEPEPGPAAGFADLTPMNPLQAKQRLAVLRDQEAQSGGNALDLQIAEHPSQKGALAIKRAEMPSLELGTSPAAAAPMSPETAQNRIESAALAAADAARRRTPEEQGRQALVTRALQAIEQRDGVASPAEARIVQEAGLGKPYDRVDESITTPLSTDEKLTQATGIALAKSPRETVVTKPRQTPTVAEESQQAAARAGEAGMAEHAAQQGLRAQARAVGEQAAARAAATPPAAPTVADTLAAMKVAPFQRTAEHKARIDAAQRAFGARDTAALRAEANGLASPEEKAAVARLREGERSSTQREEAPAPVVPETPAERPVDAGMLPRVSEKRGGLQTMTRETHGMLRHLAGLFGKKVALFEGGKRDGYVKASEPNTVYLNVASSKPHLIVFGHELLHSLKTTSPKTYAALENAVKAQLKEGALEEFAKDYGENADIEELVADLVGNRGGETEFWQGVFSKMDAPAVSRLGAAIVSAVNAMKKVVVSMAGFKTDALVKDLDAVKAAVTTAMRQFAAEHRGAARLLQTEEQNATRQVSGQESGQPEHPNRNGSGQAAEAGGGNRAVGAAAGEEATAVSPAQGVEQPRAADGTFKTWNAEDELAAARAQASNSPVRNNASGESAASLEAQSRAEQERAKGQTRLLVRRDGTIQPLFGVGAVDQRAGSGQVILQKGIGRDTWTVLEEGTDVTKSLRARALAVAGKYGEKASPQRAQTETPEFKKWFGNSKVVDADGKPLVVYHGTRKAGFSVFDPVRAGHNSGRNFEGIYFTNGAAGASTYSNSRKEAAISGNYDSRYDGEPGNYSVYLSIKNPYEVDFNGRGWDGTEDGDPDPDPWFHMDNVVARAKKGGHDGVIARNINDEGQYGQGYGWGDKTFVVFRPEQIKSAIGNNGAFDASNPDIRESARRLEVQGYAKIEKHLTEKERGKLNRGTAARLVEQWAKLPPTSEFAAAAFAGKAKRGWYRESAQAIAQIFGADAHLFTGLLAALSPKASVQSNLNNALNTWKNWIAAGRPTDRGSILKILAQSVQGTRGAKSVLGAWRPNAVRALNGADMLSGPKVNSFMRNLLGDVYEVTNDAWMANFALVDQQIFSGRLSKSDSGKGSGYLAMSAKVRAAAEMLTKLTGEAWSPAEVQETIWSWAKTLYEAQVEGATARDILYNEELTDDMIRSTPDFKGLFHDDKYAAILRDAGYGDQLARLSSGRASKKGSQVGGQTAPFAPETQARLLDRSAARLEKLKEQGLPAEQDSPRRPGQLDNIEAYHYSIAPRKTLSASAFGTGLKDSGREEYLSADDERRRKRIYFYVDKGTGVRPEIGAGSYPHKATLSNVYDVNEDPLGLKKGIQAATETAILDAGFSGYLDRLEGTQSGQVIMLGDQTIPVQPLEPGPISENAQVKPLAPKASGWEPYSSGPLAQMEQKAEAMRGKSTWAKYNIRVVPDGESGRLEVREKGVGTAIVNIVLNVPDGSKITVAQAVRALEEVGATVSDTAVHISNAEPTLVATLEEPLTKEQGERVSAELGQEAIAQKTDQGGDLFGPMAENWGPYNPEFFLMPEGRRDKEPTPAPAKPTRDENTQKLVDLRKKEAMLMKIKECLG